jgi:hypothetical protein
MREKSNSQYRRRTNPGNANFNSAPLCNSKFFVKTRQAPRRFSPIGMVSSMMPNAEQFVCIGAKSNVVEVIDGRNTPYKMTRM